MVSLSGLGKPQYLFRPSQIVRRLWRELRPGAGGSTVRLPWGLDIVVDPGDTVGQALLRQGIYDLLTTETLWRLTERGDRTADIGANIGYMTSVLATRTGAGGSVLAFEPHPKTFALLEANVRRWREAPSCAPISIRQGAISDREGTAQLGLEWQADTNISHATLTTAASPAGIEVQVWRFTQFLDEGAHFGVVKVDTEGHEAKVFAGMAQALSEGRLRDIVYEENAGYPAASHTALKEAGYTLFTVEERLGGPRLISPEEQRAPRRVYDILPSYIATRQPERARQLFERRGWQSLRA